MCLYPRIIRNPKYLPNKKNGGHVPKARDPRLLYVSIGCGKCIECRRQRANNWKVRLSEELETNPNAMFVTLTFSEESLNWFKKSTNDENTIAKQAIRYFNERWRKKYKKAPRHWLITELGHENTERLHLHGIIWGNEEQKQKLEALWKYGNIYIGEYVDKSTINYIVKYVTKLDNDHPNFDGKIFASKGLGSGYNKKTTINKYNGEETKEYYITKEGYKIALPMYYRDKIYNDDEKEMLWLMKLDKKERYINGIKYPFKTREEKKKFIKALTKAQKKNREMGYSGTEWKTNKYLESLKKLKKS